MRCETCCLGDVCTFIDYRGKTPPKTSSGIPLVTAKIVKNGMIQEPQEFIAENYYDEWMRRGIPQKGDVVFTTEAPLGEVARIKTDDKLAFAQRIIILEPNTQRLNAGYLFYALQDSVLKNRIAARATGTTVIGIKAAELKKVEIDLPPLQQQEKIADTLSSLDNKIELNNKINENLEQQATAIFKSWFIDYLPYGGVVPNEWRTVTLDDITSLVSRGINPQYSDNTEQIVINQKCIRNHMLDLSLARTHTPKTINEKWLQFGDLLINSTGTGTLGRVAQVWFEPKNLTVDSHITIVRPLREDLIFYIGLWGILHENMIESLHTGSTGQTELPREMVKAIELLLPDNETLNRFNAVVAPIAATIVLNQEENQKLAQIRDILLPKLMSGELTVSNF